LTVFTTRIDTIFGVTFISIAPEHEWINQLVTENQKKEVEKYVNWAKNRSERERQSEVKNVSGAFTGSYAINPFNNEKIPIWIADYVLAGYGTGVVMGVPSSDDRDFRFARHFDLPIIHVIEGTSEMENPTEKKYGKMINSGFLDGFESKEAIEKAIAFIENNKIGNKKINFRLRDAVFSRQRYWGEPIPIYFKSNGLARPLKLEQLPLELPKIDTYKPTEKGEPPLGRAEEWKYEEIITDKNGKVKRTLYDYELTTMPGWAGSSWYFLRYMDAQNDQEFCRKELSDYWNQVDLYVGGTEHAVGHLLYSRFWTQFLYDRGYISFSEPFKKLVNQGMIQGVSSLIYRLKGENKYISNDLKDSYSEDALQELHVDVNIVENNVLDIEAYKKWRNDEEWQKEMAQAEFITSSDGHFYCGSVVEKMSKRYYNVVNPDDVVAKYSADTMRLYEMFLGPLEQSKPWNTQGIDGTHRFLKKLWRLFYDDKGNWLVQDETPTPAELKVLHTAIKGVTEDIERLSFNTPVSKFMVCVNHLTDLKCAKRAILQEFLQLLAPYSVHITEELWHQLGNQGSIHLSEFPIWDEAYLLENSIEYPVQINGKLRTNLTFPADMSKEEIEKLVLENEVVQKWLEGSTPKKVVVVPKKIINVVI
jgi:leucyl-tRNA synthetase